MKEHGLDSLDALADLLKKDQRCRMGRQVVDAMTTNETLFFRDQYPFDALGEVMLPETKDSPVRIWSAASSTGQEAYSIAMTAAEAGSRVQILGTDISEQALAKAAGGTYTQMEVQRGMPARLLIKYFEQDNTNWRLKPEIRNMVRFQPANLVAPSLVSEMRGKGPFDIVFCRNVLIYFDVNARLQVIDNLAASMKDGGYLVTGAAEIPKGEKSSWEAVHFGNRNLWKLAARR